MRNKNAQVTMFIILAIFIVAAAVLFFAFKDSLVKNKIPAEISPVYNSFTSCLEEELSVGISVLESQGGYIYVPKYEAGSEYMPFSSHLNFLGNPIPYWYYVSGNNIEREQVPSKNEMENQLERFIEEEISNCLFKEYYSRGYEISMGTPKADVLINNNEVILDLNMNFVVLVGDESYSTREHKVFVSSELGSLYSSAIKVYEKEQESLFLEEYSIDVLRMYAPVDGVELSCSPLVWEANTIFNELQSALEANILALNGVNNKEKYSDIEIGRIPSNQKIKFLNSPNWPYSFEVLPSEENFLIANPVGTQQGLGILGFCYVPYHFVYDIKYPVLVQITSGNEIFQFPLAVIIRGNKPREALEGSSTEDSFSELCENKNNLVNVNIYNRDFEKLEGIVSYQCLGTTCLLGESSNGIFYERFPSCVNGFIVVRTEGYKEGKVMHTTTVSGTSTSIFLDKLYNLNLKLKLDGRNYNGEAIIHFTSEDDSKTIIYPQETKVELGEGEYEIQVSIYKNSSLNLTESTTEQCIDVPKGGVGSLLGLTEKECFEVSYPAQIISSALVGGGKQALYISEDKLKISNTLELNSESLPSPDSLEQLQENYILFESKSLGVNLK